MSKWPHVSHSPIDSYRCENEDCPSEYEVWQFRPDDYELDESIILCPACGQVGELFLRQFRSDRSTVTPRRSRWQDMNGDWPVSL